MVVHQPLSVLVIVVVPALGQLEVALSMTVVVTVYLEPGPVTVAVLVTGDVTVVAH